MTPTDPQLARRESEELLSFVFAFGSVGEWMMATLAGIQPDEMHPGLGRFFLRP